MSDVPSGWARTTLADLVSLKTGPFGSALHKSDYVVGGVPLINPSHIRNGTLAPDPNVSVDASAHARLREYCLQVGDVVMGRRGEMGRCAVVKSEAEGWLCGTGSVIVRPSQAINPPFLQRFLSAPAMVEALNGDSVGSTMVNLNQGILLALPVALPPLPEQKRIADQLDTVLARVDACRERLARVAPLLRRFRQAVLAAATSGRLTADLREPSNRDWTHTPPSELRLHCDLDVGYAFKSAEFEDEGVRLLRGDNIEPGRLRWIDAKCFPAAKLSDLRHLLLREGDVVLAMDRPIISTGLKIARVVPADLPAVLVQRVCRFRPRQQLQTGFLYCVLQGSAFVQHLGSKQNGSSIPHISGSQILSFAIQLPTVEEQTEIVRRVETLFAFADRLEARLAQAQTAVDRLTPSLLAKAFRGELVPQDPADEPAAELLKRLAAQREATPARKRRERTVA